MRPLPVAAAAFLTLALSGAALSAAAQAQAPTESEKLLDQAAFAESEDSTQVQEEEAVEKKDGMDAPAKAANPAATDAVGGTAAAPK